MLWTGASPQRCELLRSINADIDCPAVHIPHNKSPLSRQGTQRILYRLHFARGPCSQSQSCSRLEHVSVTSRMQILKGDLLTMA